MRPSCADSGIPATPPSAHLWSYREPPVPSSTTVSSRSSQSGDPPPEEDEPPQDPPNMAEENAPGDGRRAPLKAFEPTKYQIEPFYGRTSEEVTQFLYLLERARNIYHWNDEVTICNFQLSLKDIALIWWINNEDELKALTWDNLKARFERRFRNQDAESAWIEFASRIQNQHESPTNFMEHKMRLQKRAKPDMVEAEIVRWIRRELVPELQKELRFFETPTLLSLETLLKRSLEDAFVNTARTTPTNVNYMATDELRTGIDKIVALLSNLTSNDRLTETQASSSSGQNDEASLSSIRCSRCLGFGHFIKNFPTPEGLRVPEGNRPKDSPEQQNNNRPIQDKLRNRSTERRAGPDPLKSNNRLPSIERPWRSFPNNSLPSGDPYWNQTDNRPWSDSFSRPHFGGPHCDFCNHSGHSAPAYPNRDQKNS